MEFSSSQFLHVNSCNKFLKMVFLKKSFPDFHLNRCHLENLSPSCWSYCVNTIHIRGMAVFRFMLLFLFSLIPVWLCFCRSFFSFFLHLLAETLHVKVKILLFCGQDYSYQIYDDNLDLDHSNLF